MVIDIDAFLDKLSNEDIKEEKIEKKEEINLDFQKNIEDKIAQLQKDATSKDFLFLKQIYDEIKKFDEDLPHKFAGIEDKGRGALKDLGNKYTDDFVKINKNNAKILYERINSKLKDLDNKINAQDFGSSLTIFKSIIEDFAYFPKSFLQEKLILNTQIKKKEIGLYNLLNQFKEAKKAEIQNQLNNSFINLKNNINSSNLTEIEQEIGKIQYLIDSIPQVLVSMFTDEKIKATKVLVNAEKFLVSKYEEEFELRSNNLNSLFEKFHENYINKNLSEILLIYNEILIQFKEMPDYFIEKKIIFYNEINDLFGKVNQLIISKNMFMFLESYEYSKKIDAINEYLKHAQKINKIDPNKLTILKEEIKKLPNKYNQEKNEIMYKVNELITNNTNLSSLHKFENFDKNTNNTTTTKKEDHQITYKKTFEPIKEKTIPLDTNIHKDLGQLKNTNSNIIKEIELHYDQLKKTNNSKEIKVLYKKIIFYLNMLHISSDKKSEIIKKVNQIIHTKKLS